MATGKQNTKVFFVQGGKKLKVEAGGVIELADTTCLNVGGSGGSLVLSVAAKPTLAQLNAGYELVPAVAGKQILVTEYWFRGIGSDAAAATDVRIQDSAGSPVVVVTALIAALASNAEVSSFSKIANVTKGAGWLTALTAGKALNLVKTGSTMTGPTSFEVLVRYKLV